MKPPKLKIALYRFKKWFILNDIILWAYIIAIIGCLTCFTALTIKIFTGL